MFSGFTFTKLVIEIEAVDKLFLPRFKGSTFRGGFGHAFKKVSCTIKDQPCNHCLLNQKCPYSYIFETPPPKNTAVMRKYRAAPHPFIIVPPLEDQRVYNKGERLQFGLVLIGRAVEYLPYFIYTFEELGRLGIGKGKRSFRLVKIETSRDKESPNRVVYDGSERSVLSHPVITHWNDILGRAKEISDRNQLTIHFLTPARIKYENRLTSDLEFHILIRNLLRRLFLLNYFHCDGQTDHDFGDLVNKAQEVKMLDSGLSWYDWERYSSSQDTRMKMGGLKGSVTFKGEFRNFLPFLLLGEYVHIGKGSSFGLGKYRLEVS